MLASRIRQIQPSLTLQITSRIKELKSAGKDVINLAAGELDYDTPLAVKEEAISAIREGFTKYTPAVGIKELRSAVAQKYQEEYGLRYENEQIIITNGAKHAIFNALFALIEPGDEVIIFSPYWVSYPEMVKLCDGIPRIVTLKASQGFRFNKELLETALSKRTKCLILNSPANPTGVVWQEEELKALHDICLERRIFVISDEIYQHLIYEGRHVPFASLSDQAYNHTITVNGVSKSHAMTGWRIGWLAAPVEVARAVAKIQSQQTSNPCSIAQRAALKALEDYSWIEEKIAELRRRRDFLVEGLTRLSLRVIKPEAAFYLFTDISSTGMDSFHFAQRLLDQALVGLIPGKAFGEDNFVRISFATSFQELEEGLKRIEKFLAEL